MKKNLKNKLVNSLKNGYKITSYSLKNLYNKSLSNLAYLSEVTIFYVTNRQQTKQFHGLIDLENKQIYIKVSNSKNYQIYLKENNQVTIENDENTYLIASCNLKETCPYFVSLNDNYYEINCYKITLKNG